MWAGTAHLMMTRSEATCRLTLTRMRTVRSVRHRPWQRTGDNQLDTKVRLKLDPPTLTRLGAEHDLGGAHVG